MRITVTRSGGFAGVEKARELDTSGRRDAAHWEELALRALSGTPDGFHYRITVDDQVLDVEDGCLSEDQRRLIRAVLEEAA
ncbi:protealysin inhibitor emfourin [Streptomyces sp. NPDC101118]|uniref:protealysin inhibitor emfourin n=1 Tax=Streptomyces sp. NPDC101118 TaxID=3366109 RepID=UPI003805384C